jgi:hypothetical protein
LADIVAPEKRSQMMAGIHGKDAQCELLVRRGLYHKGFRFKLHDSSLPGAPDIDVIIEEGADRIGVRVPVQTGYKLNNLSPLTEVQIAVISTSGKEFI